jgi:hypothetical protein
MAISPPVTAGLSDRSNLEVRAAARGFDGRISRELGVGVGIVMRVLGKVSAT